MGCSQSCGPGERAAHFDRPAPAVCSPGQGASARGGPHPEAATEAPAGQGTLPVPGEPSAAAAAVAGGAQDALARCAAPWLALHSTAAGAGPAAAGVLSCEVPWRRSRPRLVGGASASGPRPARSPRGAPQQLASAPGGGQALGMPASCQQGRHAAAVRAAPPAAQLLQGQHGRPMQEGRPGVCSRRCQRPVQPLHSGTSLSPGAAPAHGQRMT
mmetsp:Transcript_22508/g.69676  ORF Transcript_22508/g.69676 Transcript_22508/m.69676 type:complete len:214 (-) Transcript_22508:257-898(-)